MLLGRHLAGLTTSAAGLPFQHHPWLGWAILVEGLPCGLQDARQHLPVVPLPPDTDRTPWEMRPLRRESLAGSDLGLIPGR